MEIPQVFKITVSQKFAPNRDLTKPIKFTYNYNVVFVMASSLENAITKVKDSINDPDLIIYNCDTINRAIVIE